VILGCGSWAPGGGMYVFGPDIGDSRKREKLIDSLSISSSFRLSHIRGDLSGEAIISGDKGRRGDRAPRIVAPGGGGGGPEFDLSLRVDWWLVRGDGLDMAGDGRGR
jgi:hypothetical protein